MSTYVNRKSYFGQFCLNDHLEVDFTWTLDHPFFKDLECTIGLSKNNDKSKSYFSMDPLIAH